MSLAPPPLQAWRDMPPVWARWFQALFSRVGGSAVGGSTEVSLATLASPALTGTPTAPTAAVDTNSTQLATTAFVLGQAASATPVMDGTAAAGASTRYARADHVHPAGTWSLVTASAEAALTGSRVLTASTDIALDTGTAGQIKVAVSSSDAWHDVGNDGGATAFANSWVNYGSGYANTRYRKIAGVVHVQMAMKDGGINAGGDVTIFTLPAGYRPSAIFSAPWQAELNGDLLYQLRVESDGDVIANGLAGNTGAFASFSFPADQ